MPCLMDGLTFIDEFYSEDPLLYRLGVSLLTTFIAAKMEITGKNVRISTQTFDTFLYKRIELLDVSDVCHWRRSPHLYPRLHYSSLCRSGN